MGVNVQSGSTTATGTFNQTIISGHKSGEGTRNTAGTTTLATITAGKTGKVIGYSLSQATSATGQIAQIQVDGVTIARLDGNAVGIGAISGVIPYSQAPQCAATHTITLVTSSGQVAGACVVYIEE